MIRGKFISRSLQLPQNAAYFAQRTCYSKVIVTVQHMPDCYNLSCYKSARTQVQMWILWNGVRQMRQPSIVIHKGRGEEKYELYVEDYVISFLKNKADGLDLTDLSFYGSKEGSRYVVYGAGRQGNLAVFDKYELLGEIGCRLDRTGPVFLIREADGAYEIKGYKIFYHDNEEMQDYLIHQNQEEKKQSFMGEAGSVPDSFGGQRFTNRVFPAHGTRYHNAISLQVGIVFVVLVAIVINSANSYGKMEQLNQSAAEVFFVMENQETDGPAGTDETARGKEQNDIIVERESLHGDISDSGLHSDMSDNGLQDGLTEDTVLQDNVLYENTMQGQGNGSAEAAAHETETDVAADITEESASGDDEGLQEETKKDEQADDEIQQTEEAEADGELQQEEEDDGKQTAEEGVEALSRNVARYYEVERGDTLYLISQKIYGDTAHVKKICELNQITNPDNIRYGQKIILP